MTDRRHPRFDVAGGFELRHACTSAPSSASASSSASTRPTQAWTPCPKPRWPRCPAHVETVGVLPAARIAVCSGEHQAAAFARRDHVTVDFTSRMAMRPAMREGESQRRLSSKAAQQRFRFAHQLVLIRELAEGADRSSPASAPWCRPRPTAGCRPAVSLPPASPGRGRRPRTSPCRDCRRTRFSRLQLPSAHSITGWRVLHGLMEQLVHRAHALPTPCCRSRYMCSRPCCCTPSRSGSTL